MEGRQAKRIGDVDNLYTLELTEIKELSPKVWDKSDIIKLLSADSSTVNVQPQTKSVNNKESFVKTSVDEEFFSAIESGDMDKVQQMVIDQANAKGYYMVSDYMGGHTAPRRSKGEYGYYDLEFLEGRQA